MADCKISQEMRMNGITPVDNIFISEFMLSSPGDFVKVYIYALMQCYMGLDANLQDMAQDLAMETDMVNNAFSYWERKGLVKKNGHHYIFESPMTVVACNAVSGGNTLCEYRDFNSALYEILSGRNITTADFEMAYDWIEIYGMSQGCVLEMISYAVNHKYKSGIKVSFTTLNKMALAWVDKGITTEDKAKKYIGEQLVTNSDAKAILSHLGQYRNPTVDEYNLLLKWERDYGFSLDAILACCSEMVYSKNPSFALLDTILTKHHESGAHSIEDIQAEKLHDDSMFDLYREVVQRCGGFGSATKPQREVIDDLLKRGLNKQGLLYICDYLVEQDIKGLSHTVNLAKELCEKGITDENAICEELEFRKTTESKVKEFLNTAGFTRKPTVRDKDMYLKYLSTFGSHDIMLKAAQYAQTAKNRSQHLAKLLTDWEARGVRNIEDAVDIAPTPDKTVDKSKEYIRNNRTYSDDDLFNIYE